MGEITAEALALLRLGFVFMLSGVMTQAVTASVILILQQQLNEQAVGYMVKRGMLSGYLRVSSFAMGTGLLSPTDRHRARPSGVQTVSSMNRPRWIIAGGPGVDGHADSSPGAIASGRLGKILPARSVTLVLPGMLLRAFSWPMAFGCSPKLPKTFFCTEFCSNVFISRWFGLG